MCESLTSSTSFSLVDPDLAVLRGRWVRTVPIFADDGQCIGSAHVRRPRWYSHADLAALAAYESSRRARNALRFCGDCP